VHSSTYDYLKPTDEQLERMNRLREAAKMYGIALEDLLPEGPDKTFIIRSHRTTAMCARRLRARRPLCRSRLGETPRRPAAGLVFYMGILKPNVTITRLSDGTPRD